LVIGLFLLLLDIAAIVYLLIAIAVAAFRLRPSQLATRSVALRRSASLVVLVVALGLVVVGQAWFVTSSDNQGRPAPSQVIGTWTDSDGATLKVLPDGTFTAAGLPADSEDPAGDGKPHPAGGHGTWQIEREDGAWYVSFTLSGGSEFQFESLASATRGHAGTAVFAWVFPEFNAVDLWYFYRP